MMIHVPVAETLPLGVAHAAEECVFAPLEGARPLGESFEEPVQFGEVGNKLRGLCTTNPLVPFRTRGKSMRPWKRQPQGCPPHGQTRDPIARAACFPFTHARSEDVARVTNHLVGGHLAPATRTRWLDSLQARDDFGLIFWIGERLHAFTHHFKATFPVLRDSPGGAP
jgi:hypothetical protein